MTTGAQIAAQVQAAQQIESKSDVILREWEAETRQRCEAADSMESRALLDHIPLVLAALQRALREKPDAAKSDEPDAALDFAGMQHGMHRAEQDSYNVGQVIREYSILLSAVLRHISSQDSLDKRTVQQLNTFFGRAVENTCAHYENLNEAGLRAESDHLQVIFDSGPDCMKILDWDTIVLKINPQGAELLGLTSDADIVGTHWLTFWRGAARTLARQAVEDAKRGAIGRFVGACSISGERVKWWDVVITRIRAMRGHHPHQLLAVSRDITKMKHAEQELEQVVSALKEERDLRQRFVAALAHDLRNPIAAAMLNAEQMANRLAAGKPGDDRASQRLQRSLQRVDGMIVDLLDASSITAEKPMQISLQPADLCQIIDNAIETLAQKYGPRFVVTTDATPFMAVTDAGRMCRVVENLASNAVKYGDPTAPITLSLTHSAPFFRLRCHNLGRPISAAVRAKMFQAFHRSDDPRSGKQEGWGIGLTLVEGIAKALQGRVECCSEAGFGTAFDFYAPLEGKP